MIIITIIIFHSNFLIYIIKICKYNIKNIVTIIYNIYDTYLLKVQKRKIFILLIEDNLKRGMWPK